MRVSPLQQGLTVGHNPSLEQIEFLHLVHECCLASATIGGGGCRQSGVDDSFS